MDNYPYRRAKTRVTAKKEFYRHLGTYYVMSVFFIILNSITSPGYWWFMWPMLGWGLAVLFHYVDVFGVPGAEPINKEWEERELRREMDRMEKNRYRDRRKERGRGANNDHRSRTPDNRNPAPDENLELRPLPRHAKKWDESDLV